MSQLDTAATLPARPEGRRLRLRQAWTVARQEMKRNFLGLRALGLYVVTGFPVLLLATGVTIFLYMDARDQVGVGPTLADLSGNYAGVFDGLILRLVIFFVALIVFSRLVRAEIQQRSLHYYFLAPLRRTTFGAGKFVGGLVSTTVLIGLSTAATYLINFVPLVGASGSGGYLAYMTRGGGLATLMAYELVVVLGVLGYGAMFFAIGLWFKNPIVPAVLLFGWEWLNFLLPPFLKRISVVHYLRSLQPVTPDQGTFALVADPPHPVVSVLGLLLVAAAFFALGAWKLRQMEIHYGDE